MPNTTPVASSVQTLLSVLNVSAYSPEEQEKLLADVSSTIFQGSLVRFVEQMDEPTRNAFSKLVDKSADENEVVRFLKEHVENADDIVLEVVREMIEDISALEIQETATQSN